MIGEKNVFIVFLPLVFTREALASSTANHLTQDLRYLQMRLTLLPAGRQRKTKCATHSKCPTGKKSMRDVCYRLELPYCIKIHAGCMLPVRIALW